MPFSVEQVVDLLYNDLSFKEKFIIAHLSESELDSSLYTAMAKIIRKEFGLYTGNTDLLNSCCSYMGTTYDPGEDPVMVIIKELWKKTKKTHTLHLVDTRKRTAAH